MNDTEKKIEMQRYTTAELVAIRNIMLMARHAMASAETKARNASDKRIAEEVLESRGYRFDWTRLIGWSGHGFARQLVQK